MELVTDLVIKVSVLLVIVVYMCCLIVIFCYSLLQLNMLKYFKIYQKKNKLKCKIPEKLPRVTIQLPLYNEFYVIKRLLKCITNLEYPKELIQIQVLDDSTDESLLVTKKIVSKYKEKGLSIHHIIRTKRKGFKAGALKNGLRTASGEFIAIFDSDFLPNPDWLLKTIPYFQNNKVGVVQTRWGHLNREHSILTQAQAFALDAHFLLEQVGRNQQKHFINFNGTAGIWRKDCIMDSGNWKADTLTEDLDLSYRAQLKDWEFVYLDNVVTPAELPITINAIRSQQFRWNKGGAENFRKLVAKVVFSEKYTFNKKINAFFHLFSSNMFVNVFLISILSVPLIFIKETFPEYQLIFNMSSLFILSTIIFFYCYWHVHKYTFGGGFYSFLIYVRRFINFYTLMLGFSVHNSVAVLEAYLGKKSAFIRTPKFNQSSLKNFKYSENKISPYSLLELVLSIYFLFGILCSLSFNKSFNLGMFLFHLVLFIGFGIISYFGISQNIKNE